MTSSSEGTWAVEWSGTATFRVRRPGLDLFFDGYLDRLPGLDPVGLTTGEVKRADFVFVSHAHFDHLYGVGPRPPPRPAAGPGPGRPDHGGGQAGRFRVRQPRPLRPPLRRGPDRPRDRGH